MFISRKAKSAHTLRAALAAAVLLGSFGLACAQTPQVSDWSAATSAATGVALDLDAAGNVSVLGVKTPTSFDAGVGTLTLDRLGPQGTRLWSQTWVPPVSTGATAGARPVSVFSDTAGNTFVLGSFEALNYCISTTGTCTPGPIGTFSAGWAVLKFGPDGSLLWQHLENNIGFVATRGVADASGNVYVMVDPRSAGRTMPTVKLSGLDGSTLWTRYTNDGAKPGHMALAPNGNVLLSTAANISGLTVLEYAAGDGSVVWSRRYPQGAGYYVTGLAANPQGDVAVSGTHSTGGAFVAAFDATRATLFEATYAEAYSAPLLAFTPLRQLYVSGTTAPTTSTVAPYANWYTLKLDAAGNRLLPASIVDAQSLAHEVPYDMALSTDGAVYVAGKAGPGLSTTSGATPATVRRYSADGSTAWSARQVDAGAAIDVAAAADGSAYVLGNSPATLWHYPAAANQLPIASLALATPPAVPAPLTAYLDASGSMDPDGSIASYQWSFGDGGTTATASPLALHTYAAPGSYPVSVVPVDNLGLAGAAATLVVSVTQPVLATIPTALSFSSASVVGGRSVTGTVRVSASSGTVVKLTSSRATVASVPASVTVPAGASQASFTVRTSRVSARTAVTITATANGKSVSSVLTVTR